MEGLGAVLGAMGVFAVLIIALVVVLYVLNGLGTSYVLKQMGFKYPWFAWIPILNFIALALACRDSEGNITLFGIKIPGIVFSLWYILVLVVTRIPNVGSILSIVVQVIFYGRTLQLVYSKMEGTDEKDNAILGYVSGFITIIPLIKFLMYRSAGKKNQ